MDIRCQFTAGIAKVITMTTTIQHALHPLLVTAFLIGLGVYPLRKTRFYLKILYILMFWICYVCLCYYIVTFLELEAMLLEFFTMAKVHFCALTTITSIVLSLFYDKKFRKFLKRLGAVDDTLEKLGIPKVYRKLHTQIKGMIVVWIICSISGNIGDMIWWLSMTVDHRNLIVPYILNHFYHVQTFVDLSFMIILWYVGTRFDKVNELVNYLWMKEKQGLRCIWRKAVPTTHRYIMCTDNYKHVFWTSMHLHLELCKITRELNSLFGIQITLEMVAYLISMTAICYYTLIMVTFASVYMWINVYIATLIIIAKLIYLNYLCESVSAKASEMRKVIHQLTDPIRYADIRDEICQFTLQMMQHPLKITGLDFFTFGYNFLRKFFLTIVTFEIIILQVKPFEVL